jgi:hypothetical protein
MRALMYVFLCALFLATGVHLLLNEHPVAGGWCIFGAFCCIPTYSTTKPKTNNRP